MSVGDRIVIQKQSDEGKWEDYIRTYLLQANKTRSKEYAAAGGEQNEARVTFRLRWVPPIAEIEFDMPRYRILWRGHVYDVRGYDDYMYQHRKVDLAGVAHG